MRMGGCLDILRSEGHWNSLQAGEMVEVGWKVRCMFRGGGVIGFCHDEGEGGEWRT